MLINLLRFELKYHFRQLTFITAAIIFMALGFLMSKGNFGGPELQRNAPYVINYIVNLLSLMSIFTATVFCANVVLRDEQSGMDSLVHSSGIKKWQWYLVRLSGLVIAVSLVLIMAMPGCWLGWMMVHPVQLGPSSLLHYAWPLLVFGLPDILFCCSLVFCAAVLGKNARSVYTAGLLLFVLYFTGSVLGNSPLMAGSVLKTEEVSIVPYLLDPFGIMSYFGETRNWTVIRRNEDLFPLSGIFLLNRLIWILLSLGLLLISFRFSSFRVKTISKERKQEIEKKQPDLPALRPLVVNPAGRHYKKKVFAAQLRLETGAIFRHLPFLFLLLLWIFLFAIDLKEEALEGPYGIRYYATTGFLVEKLRSIHPALFLLVFYAGEILHRERTVRIHGLIFSTPAPGWILWLAKAATLLVLVLMLVTANIATGIGIQLYAGAVPEIPGYLELYYLSAWPVFLFAILILFVQALIRNKFLGMMISLLVCSVFVFSNLLGIRSMLLRYATLPNLRYSELNGFGHYTTAVNWYMLYWTLLAVLLAWIAAGRWQRHIAAWVPGKNGRNRSIPFTLSICVIAFLGTGAFIYSQSDNASSSRNSKASDQWKHDYEITYGKEKDTEQPVIIAVSTRVDLYPNEQRYEVRGSYRLKNITDHQISKIWLGVNPDVDSISWNLPASQLVRSDARFKQYWFALPGPLQPGAETSVHFSMFVNRGSFKLFNSEHSVVENGTYVELEKYVPWLGYNPGLEIDDPAQRAEKKLPPQQPPTGTDSNYYFIDYETIISTNADQHAVTVGKLIRNWKEGDRSYFHYLSENKIPFMFALSSARYAIKMEKWNGTDYSIFYQPGQEQNLPVMMQAMKDAITYGSQHFCNYPSSSISLAVVPHYPGAATAYPGVMFCAEKINFKSDFSDTTKFNAVYTVTAHETAHQWWADILSPSPVPGSAMLTESLAKYTEYMVTEKKYGPGKLWEYLQKDHQLYFNLRNMNSEKELPLLQSDQSFVYYQKGGLALYAIKNEIGEAQMNAALKRMLLQYGPDKHRPMPADLLTELLKNTTASQQQYIKDRLQSVIHYDAGIRLRSCHQLPDGAWELELQLKVKKWDHTNGKPVQITPDEAIEIAISNQGSAPGIKPIAIKRIPVSSEAPVIKLILQHKPVKVLLDPNFSLPDENRDDNELRIL
ncbi:M1 family aminopeptidase [Pseudobacter ginsenosidimutans]|uniref:Peptidase M1-like protein n=1 Tax=Pseudobacter ginsenosidimutans TaxID=661488 RepID=A0A4Q7N5E0_9BACT|nr:M1 family aminopeptidase [Pseudobacter ginsenosidimutans]QEC44767.1 hypothetical protein FSB84_24920 [Pseudobacter ginsenosidimutans]RZS76251.1 peptidase M1-like protein [Pseudobacter ginsenosidimutans]